MGGSRETLLPLHNVTKSNHNGHHGATGGIGGQHQPRNPIHPVLWKCLLLVGVSIYGSYAILIHACESDGHTIPFSSSSVVIMIEVTKLLACSALSTSQLSWSKAVKHLTFRSCLPFSIPAALYCINNNIAIHMQIQMDPATFQIMSNLKILSTALLYRLIMQRPISPLQWFSLILLTVAGGSHSYGGLKDKDAITKEVYITWQGLAMMILYCTLSGLSGVYSEYILKKQQQLSLVIQNIVLYIYGVAFNSALYIFTTSGSESNAQWFFEGYSFWTWILILTQAVNGLIISAIMKHSSNITRLFVISSAMIVTTVLSVLIFSLELNAYLIAACLLVVISLVLYHRKSFFNKKR